MNQPRVQKDLNWIMAQNPTTERTKYIVGSSRPSMKFLMNSGRCGTNNANMLKILL